MQLGAVGVDDAAERVLVGEWAAEDHTLDSDLGAGVPVTSIEEYSWLDGGYFLVGMYDSVFGDEPAQRGVTYWG